MRQFVSIAVNAFMELVRQPIFLILMAGSAGFSVFLSAVPYFGFGDDPKLVKDTTLAVTLLSGLLTAVLCASASVAQEIRTGTALTVLSKPVSRVTFLLGKFAGLAGALVLVTYTNMVAALLASRMAFDAYGSTDVQSLTIYFSFVLLAFVAGGFSNFFLRRTFVSDAVGAFVVCTTIALVIVVQFTHLERAFDGEAKVDWRLVPAGVLILFALWVLAALALACSTRLDTVPTLAVCSGIFLVGLVADYLFKGAADSGAWWAKIGYAVTPNWQQFWLADALEGTKSIPWSYVAKAAGYAVAYLGAALALALAMFEDRELN
jgi:ABC-type transport system involved in multi-copper enzyme maturation permease subunit